MTRGALPISQSFTPLKRSFSSERENPQERIKAFKAGFTASHVTSRALTPGFRRSSPKPTI
jgi:hypothetical protein